MNETELQKLVRYVRKHGVISVNVLKYRRSKIIDPLFEAAKRGALVKKRVNCAIYEFTVPR